MAVKPKVRRDLEIGEMPAGQKTACPGMDITGTSS